MVREQPIRSKQLGFKPSNIAWKVHRLEILGDDFHLYLVCLRIFHWFLLMYPLFIDCSSTKTYINHQTYIQTYHLHMIHHDIYRSYITITYDTFIYFYHIWKHTEFFIALQGPAEFASLGSPWCWHQRRRLDRAQVPGLDVVGLTGWMNFPNLKWMTGGRPVYGNHMKPPKMEITCFFFYGYEKIYVKVYGNDGVYWSFLPKKLEKRVGFQ